MHNQFLFFRSKLPYFIAGTALVLATGFLDYISGYHLSIMFLYFIPVALVTLACGKDSGILISVLSSFTCMSSEFMTGVPYDNLFIPAWNMLVRFIVFLSPAFIIELIKKEVELKGYKTCLEEAVKERTCKIQELNKQVEFVLGATKTGLDIIDAEYNIVYIDPEWKKLYGEPAGKKCYEYFMGKTSACLNCGIKEALKTKKTVVSEETLSKEGDRPIRVISTPYQDNKGNWLIAEVNVDISKEKVLADSLEKHRAHLEEIVEERTRELRESEKKFRLAFESALDAILWADPETGILVDCNKATEEMFEKTKDEIIGRHYTSLHPPDKKEAIMNTFQNQSTGKMGVIEADIITKSDKIKTVLISCSVTEIEGKTVMQGVFHDITIRKEMEDACRISEESYRSIFESANDAILVRDIKTYKIVDVNEKGCELFCYKREEMQGLDLQAVIPGDQPHAFQSIWNNYEKAATGEPQIFEQLVRDKIGREFWVEVSLKRAIIGKQYRLLAITRDITERKESENKIIDLNKALSKANENLKHLVLRDSHTGLYNHHYFVDAIEAELERAKRYGEELSIIMMDIDYFKSINDVYGHQFGDTILKQFARLLKREVRIYDIVVRLGGEEFIIMSPGVGKNGALLLTQRILDTVGSHSFGDKKHSIKIKISAAVSSYPEDKDIYSGSDFVDVADRILNKAKEDGGNRVYSAIDLETKKDSVKIQEDPDVDILKQKIRKLTARGNQSVVEAIFAFAKTIELKDRYTGEHVEKTIHYATSIAQTLGLPKNDIEIIKEASVLHDLGKIGIPENILLKTGKLTRREREVIKDHPHIGADIIRPIHFLRDIIPVILHHHEWWNGRGYPHQLKKEAIPIGARIVAIADVYQALTTDRPYRKAYPKEMAVRIIRKGSGKQFDPRIVNAFLEILKKEP